MAVDFNNPANYKKCSKKNYEIYVCMPPENTVVINKLEQADVLRSMGGKEYYTATEIDNMSRHNPQKLQAIQSLVQQGKAYAVTKNTPFVLCGTVGEMWTISPQKLQATYTFVQNGQPLQINMQTLEQRKKNGVLDWTVVRTSASAVQGVNMACFVPKAQKGQIQTSWGAVLNINGVGVNHGLGDFIVCAMLPNGTPNLQDRWVVNGNVFATTYNNKGWENCINVALAGRGGVETIKTLPQLFYNYTSSSELLNWFKDHKMYDIVDVLTKHGISAKDRNQLQQMISIAKYLSHGYIWSTQGDAKWDFEDTHSVEGLCLVGVGRYDNTVIRLYCPNRLDGQDRFDRDTSKYDGMKVLERTVHSPAEIDAFITELKAGVDPSPYKGR